VTEHALLMRLVEDADRLEPDWADALRRTGFVRGRLGLAQALRPRRVVALVAVVLLAALAVSAIASERPRRPVYWLFDRSPQTYPSVQTPRLGPWTIDERARSSAFCRPTVGCPMEVLRVPVVEGAVAGHNWEMVVYFGERQGGRIRLLFVGLNPGGTPAAYHGTDVPALLGGAMTGDVVRWMPGGEDAEDRLFWGDGVYIPGPIREGGGTGPKWHYGPAAPNVAEIDLENDDGRIVKVPTFEGPPSLPAPTRLWVAALPLTHLVHSIAARDAEGNLLERHELPIAQ
jgi:hypothetical protein